LSEARILTESVLAKVREQGTLLQDLVSRVPEGRTGWRPDDAPEAFTFGDLLGHLLECLAGVCAVLYAVHPEPLAHFAALRDRPVNGECTPADAAFRLREYLRYIEEGFALMTDHDLARRIPTVFVPEGETALTLLLGNLEHVLNHKYQLFFYLKLLGVRVATPDLYRLRG
jgi:DinB superfamily